MDENMIILWRIHTINFKELMWMSTSLLCSKACQITNAKPVSSLTQCSMWEKMGDDPIATWKRKNGIMVFRQQSLQGYESNRWHADGVRVENIPRNHSFGPPQEDSKSNDRQTYTASLQRQDHLHVHVQRHCMVRKTKQTKM